MKNQKRPIVVTVDLKTITRRFRSLGEANYYLLRLNENVISHFDFVIRNLNTGRKLDEGRL